MEEIIDGVSGHRLYIHPKLIKRAKTYFEWIPKWYMEELTFAIPTLMHGFASSKSREEDLIIYLSIIFAAFNRTVITSAEDQRFMKYKAINSTLSPVQEKTDWLVKIYNDLNPNMSIPSDRGAGLHQYKGWGLAHAQGGFAGADKFGKLILFIKTLKLQNWSIFMPYATADRTKGTSHKDNTCFDTIGYWCKHFVGGVINGNERLNYPSPSSIDNPVLKGAGVKTLYRLGRFVNFFNEAYAQRRKRYGLFNLKYNYSLYEYSSRFRTMKLDIPFMFFSNQQHVDHSIINYLTDPLLKSKQYITSLRRNEEKLQRNKELHTQVIKSYNTRNLNRYYKYVQKSLRYSLDYINKDSILSIKNRDYTKPGVYFNMGLILDTHNYVTKNLKVIKNREDEGGGHLKPGNRYHTITLNHIMDGFLTFQIGKTETHAKDEVEGLVWAYIMNTIPSHKLPTSTVGRGKLNMYNVLFNWCGPLDNFIESIDSKSNTTIIRNTSKQDPNIYLVIKNSTTKWKIPSILLVNYE
jgi:hypothetical protein